MSIFLVIVIGLFAALYFISNSQTHTLADTKNSLDITNVQTATKLTNSEEVEAGLYTNNITSTELEEKLKNKENVLVYFYKPTCPYCQKTTPIVMPMANQMGLTMYHYNVDAFPEGYESYKLTGVPTLIKFTKGKETHRLVGYYEDEMEYENWFISTK